MSQEAALEIHIALKRIEPLMHLNIAGVTFGIQTPGSAILKDPNPSYRDFLHADGCGRESDVRVTVDFDKTPDTVNLSKIFDGGSYWSMWRSSDHYLITLHSLAEENELICAAEFDSSAENVTVYPGRDMTEAGVGDPEVFNPFCYPLDQILLVYYLTRRKGALIHAAGIEKDGKGYIFPGRSGAGKTTLTRQFVAANRSGFLSDDRIVVRRTGAGFTAFGTPWPGEGKIAINKGADLDGIFFLIHGMSNSIEKIDSGRAFERLMPVASVPWYDSEAMTGVLSFCEELVAEVPAYEMHFRPDAGVVDYFEQFVSQRKA